MFKVYGQNIHTLGPVWVDAEFDDWNEATKYAADMKRADLSKFDYWVSPTP